MSFSAVLLAGGKSRRMGRDKATMVYRGRPLWENQLDVLRKLEPDQLLVSAQIDPAWRPADVEFVADAPPSRGPLSGIAAALSRTTSNHLVVLGIDTPFMTEGYLRGLSNKVAPGSGIVSIIGNRAEPLAAVYPRNADLDLVEALSGGDFSLQPLIAKLIALGKLQAIRVSGRETALFRNLNEPVDLESP